MPRIRNNTSSARTELDTINHSREVSRPTRTTSTTSTTNTSNSFATNPTPRSTPNATTPARAGVQRELAEASAPHLKSRVEQGRYLRKGDNNLAVNDLQTLLNRSGASLGVDGDFGRKTDRALRDFQTANNLKADGVVGPATFRALTGAAPQNNEPRQIERERPGHVEPGATNTNGANGLRGNFTFANNARGIEAARRTDLGQKVGTEMTKHLDAYKRASVLTGVPAELIAAIHGNESQFGAYHASSRGPESGFGLDPRFVSTSWGNDKLRQHGLGSWQRGQAGDRSVLQSAVIAAEHLKRQAGYAGVTIKPTMNQNELAGAVTGYVQGNRAGRNARNRGESWLFRPSDANPHPYHPGGTSVGRGGRTIRVAPSRKEGLLRWDTLLPLIQEKMW